MPFTPDLRHAEADHGERDRQRGARAGLPAPAPEARHAGERQRPAQRGERNQRRAISADAEQRAGRGVGGGIGQRGGQGEPRQQARQGGGGGVCAPAFRPELDGKGDEKRREHQLVAQRIIADEDDGQVPGRERGERHQRQARGAPALPQRQPGHEERGHGEQRHPPEKIAFDREKELMPAEFRLFVAGHLVGESGEQRGRAQERGGEHGGQQQRGKRQPEPALLAAQ